MIEIDDACSDYARLPMIRSQRIGKEGTTVQSWMSEGWGYRASSLDNLMTSISRVGTLTPGRRYVWRGVADWRWDVESSLQRFMDKNLPALDPLSVEDVRSVEKAVIQEARRWGLDEAGALTAQGVIALLQHHGLPTRFIDMTTDPMTALWFATATIDHARRDSSGALLAFDVTGLRALNTAGRFPTTWGALDDPDWHYTRELDQSRRERRPFLVNPTVRDPRMIAQQGLFLAGSPLANGGLPRLKALDLVAEPPGEDALRTLFASDRKRGRPAKLPFVALIVPSSLKKRLRSHLELTYSRRFSTLFPDLAGYSSYVADLGPAIREWVEEVRPKVRGELRAADDQAEG